MFKGLVFFKTLFRSFFIQATWNHERMNGLGYCFCMIPFAKRFLGSKKARQLFLKRNLGFFNTHPYMAGWLIGATLKLEEESLKTGKPSPAEIDRFKKRMSQSLGATGDQIFWGRFKPIAAMLGVVLTFYFEIWGALAFVVIFNLPHFYVRIKGLVSGYQKGFELVKDLAMRKFRGIIIKLNKFAALVVGILLIVGGYSQQAGQLNEGAAFLIGLLMMFLFLKIKLAVPMALLMIIAASVLINGFFKLI